jgi:hypothetical protein
MVGVDLQGDVIAAEAPGSVVLVDGRCDSDIIGSYLKRIGIDPVRFIGDG